MRRNFAQVLNEAKIDIKKEYSRLYSLFYDDQVDGISMYSCISASFMELPQIIRKTCLSLDDYNVTFGFDFVQQPQDFDIDYLINFCEYIYNFIDYVDNRFFLRSFSKSQYKEQIKTVIELIGYMEAADNGITIFIPKDSSAISVSESRLIPSNISYKIIAYNHHSKKGDIESKKEIIIKLVELLEDKRPKLRSINKNFSDDLFFLINNCNIRHNNKSPEMNKNYRKYIAEMSDEELEKVYDEIYQMCLLAFMQLEQINRNNWIKELKENISNN